MSNIRSSSLVEWLCVWGMVKGGVFSGTVTVEAVREGGRIGSDERKGPPTPMEADEEVVDPIDFGRELVDKAVCVKVVREGGRLGTGMGGTADGPIADK